MRAGRCVQAQSGGQTTGGEGATSHHKPMTLTYQEPLSVKMILAAPGSLRWNCATDWSTVSLGYLAPPSTAYCLSLNFIPLHTSYNKK